MSFKEFLISKVFIKNLSLAVALLVGIIMILLIWLNIYTRHGQARPVPDFYGLSLEETAKLAKKNKNYFGLVGLYLRATRARMDGHRQSKNLAIVRRIVLWGQMHRMMLSRRMPGQQKSPTLLSPRPEPGAIR